MHPLLSPSTKRLGRAPTLGGNPHSDLARRYWLAVMTLRIRPCRAKTMSLKATVGVRSLWRAAYWARMEGE
jgi:hypothetical protein